MAGEINNTNIFLSCITTIVRDFYSARNDSSLHSVSHYYSEHGKTFFTKGITTPQKQWDITNLHKSFDQISRFEKFMR